MPACPPECSFASGASSRGARAENNAILRAARGKRRRTCTIAYFQAIVKGKSRDNRQINKIITNNHKL
jgi:hypothetical protein